LTLELAKKSDINFIMEWLKAEEDAFVGADFENSELFARRRIRGFWCNRNIIQRCFKKSELYVFREENLAIAFHLGELITPGITEVHPDHRGKGIGTKITRVLIDRARSRNVCGLEIEMTPNSSRPFWEHFGFRSRDQFSDEARLSLEYDLTLTEASNCAVKVEFFTNNEWHADHRQPFKSYTIPAFKSGFSVALSKRAHPFDLNWSDNTDTFSSVHLDGEAVFDEKLKYEEANSFGFQNAPCSTYFLDQFQLKHTHIRCNSPFAKS